MRTKFLLLLPLVACAPDPVAWNETAERRATVPTLAPTLPAPDVTSDSMLAVTVAAAIGGRGGELPSVVPPPAVLSARGEACPASVRVVVGRGAAREAVWWALRPSGAASLLASRSDDGGATWTAPVAVDTLDAGAARCERPAPAATVDSINGYLHIAYALEAPDGTGVFYAHRMGPALPFERPQVIVYGDHVTPASVASMGDLAVVAYEDPNTGGSRPYVSLAITRTAGHSWAERLVVSSPSENASRPAVALRGREVAVGWVAHAPRPPQPGEDRNAPGIAQVVVRVGRIR